jgi:hypothetical protein
LKIFIASLDATSLTVVIGSGQNIFGV